MSHICQHMEFCGFLPRPLGCAELWQDLADGATFTRGRLWLESPVGSFPPSCKKDGENFSTHNPPKHWVFLHEACISMTDFSISGNMCSPSVGFLLVTVCTRQQTNGIVSSLYMHLVSSPALHTQCHTCSVNQVTFPALIQFNDWIFPTLPLTHCI